MEATPTNRLAVQQSYYQLLFMRVRRTSACTWWSPWATVDKMHAYTTPARNEFRYTAACKHEPARKKR